ncbi:copper resistance CopC family protein [Methylococcus sp. EFPC2]|uniref:copper resistance CopC family protein n=1 Tax=Methylococcus sp. EFPC2 TaxID=2812648 RepID=UPI001F075D90|nr:copper resistance CopC family protein [Methylococcus sp. EFPC2]
MKRAWPLLALLSCTAEAGLREGQMGATEKSANSVQAPFSMAAHELGRIQADVSAYADPFALASRPETPVLLAHAILVQALPDKEAVVSDAPEEILLTFNEGVGQEFLALAVVDESGKRVDKHDARQDFTDHSHLRASVEKLVPGRYMVRYRVLSADGHVVSGKYFFNVQAK